jgi:hypothetical protein
MYLRSLAAALGVLIAATTTAHAQTASSRQRYIDPDTYLTDPVQWESWYTLMSRLKSNFNEVCGDTFCEGDYNNIESLSFRCSVEQHSGRIGACVWVFAASNEAIDARTGIIEVQPRSWTCAAPLAPHTTIESLLTTLDNDWPMDTPLPNATATLYDSLIDCL